MDPTGGILSVAGKALAGPVVRAGWRRLVEPSEAEKLLKISLAAIGPSIGIELGTADLPGLGSSEAFRGLLAELLDEPHRFMRGELVDTIEPYVGASATHSAREIAEALTDALAANVPNAKSGDSLTRYVPHRTIELLRAHESEGQVTAGEADLAMLRRRSAIAAEDSQLAGFDGTKGQVRLSDGLYVERDVERRLLALLDPGSSGIALLIGRAGYGKTSVLWHLQEVLSKISGFEALLLKSSALALGNGDQGSIDAAVLRRAAAMTIERGRRPVLLIDTLDARLQSEAERDGMLELLAGAVQYGCWVVASSRPAESEDLRPLGAIREEIFPYGNEELEHAIRTHVARFYSADLSHDGDVELARILSAVANGLPIREVCESPLTLRMLFEVYAPHEISTDVHSFSLYDTYWEQRVRHDRRAGSTRRDGPESDLTAIAEATGLVLLAEGRPEIGEATLRAGLRRLNVSDSLDGLIDRGVLIRSEESEIRFFHQTFFEHAAGRAFVARGPAGIAMLSSRAQERPEDLFLAPVEEQTPLAAERADVATRTSAQAELRRLLCAESRVARASGIYVYCHLQSAAPQTASLVDEMLIDSGSELADYFIRLAGNLHDARLEGLFRQLNVVWQAHTWREHQLVVALLERLAARRPDATRVFLDNHRVIDAVLAQSAGSAVYGWPLARSIGTIAATDPDALDWASQRLGQMWRAAKSDEVRVHVARVLEERAEAFGEETIATRLRGPSEGIESASVHVRRTFARLWFREWRARGTRASQAIEEINSAPAGIVRAAMLRALADLLIREPEFDLLAVMPEQPIAVQWEWVNHMLGSLIAAYAERGVDAGSLASAVAIRAADIAAIGSRAPVRSSVSRQEESVQMRGALLAANLAPDALASLLHGRAGTDDPGTWLDHHRLGKLLAAGAIGGHVGAAEALSQIVANPHVADQRVVARARKDLERYASESQVAGAALLDLAIADADTVRLHRRLPELHHQSFSLVIERSERLVDLRRRLTESRDRDQRAGGYQLQARLIELGLEEAPGQTWLDQRLQQEHNHRSLVHVIGVVAASARLGNGPAAEILDLLMELADAGQPGVRTAAFAAAAELRSRAGARSALRVSSMSRWLSLSLLTAFRASAT